MTFAQAGNPVKATPSAKVQNFYVMAPQTDKPQGTLPFLHDHTIAQAPGGGQGFTVFMHGYFVLCSAEGISSGDCVPMLASIPGGGTLPLAETLNGHALTSVETIEAGVDTGLLVLVDTGAEFIGTVAPVR